MELTVEQALQQGVDAHKEGKLQDAERLYRAIIQSQPLHPDANHNLGVLLASMNKYDAAILLFKNALESNPKIEQFWLSYIDVLIKDKQFDNAKEVIKKGQKKGISEEKLAEAHSSLGVILQELGRLYEAEISYKKAIALKPHYSEAYNNLGVTLQELGRLKEALASYMRALKLKPNFLTANDNISFCIQSYIWRTLSREFEKNKFFEETIELEKKKLRNKLKEHPLWFIDIPRTSSKTICQIMWRQFGFPFGRRTRELDGKLIQTTSPLLPNHTHAFIAKYLIGDKIWEEIQTFSIVRNPYSWCLSLWYYCKENEAPDDTHNTFLQFLDSLELNLKANIHKRKINHKNFLQTDYLLDNDETLLVKSLLPFEDREKIKHQFRGMGINYFEGIHINKSKNSGYKMSRIEKKKVEQIFAKDFEILGY